MYVGGSFAPHQENQGGTLIAFFAPLPSVHIIERVFFIFELRWYVALFISDTFVILS